VSGEDLYVGTFLAQQQNNIKAAFIKKKPPQIFNPQGLLSKIRFDSININSGN
jgi:hypothetical protein